jgi:hypothetical protein
MAAMNITARLLSVAIVAGFGCAAAHADRGPFDLDGDEYTAGVREHGLDEETRVLGWRLRDDLYFGRRHGDIDDFGFVFQRGDVQYSLTEDGIGVRKSISLLR